MAELYWRVAFRFGDGLGFADGHCSDLRVRPKAQEFRLHINVEISAP
jgi:hypothetical protein